MKHSILLIRRNIACLCGLVMVALTWSTASGQGYLSVSGAPCTGSFMVFNGPGCDTYWDMGNANEGTHYRVDATSATSRKVTWLAPINNVQVRHCQANSDFFNVVQSGAIPSVSITTTKTSVCSSKQSSVTFTAHPVNSGANPRYRWFINGTLVADDFNLTTLTRTESSFSNGDRVYVILASDVQCVGNIGVTAEAITMTVTQATTPSISIDTNRPEVCQGQGILFFVENATNIGSTPVYTWFINGAERSSDPPRNSSEASLGPTYLRLDSWTYEDNVSVQCKVRFGAGGCITTNEATSNIFREKLKPKQSFSAGIKALPERFPMRYCQDDVSFQATVSPSGTGIANIYWYKNNESVGVNNSSTYKPAAFAQGDVVSVNIVAVDDGCLINTASTYSTSNAPITTISRPSPATASGDFYTRTIPYNTFTTLLAASALSEEEYKWYSSQNVLLGTGALLNTGVLTDPLNTFKVTKFNRAVPECESTPTILIVETNHFPVVNAGPDIDVDLSQKIPFVTLVGSATDVDGTIESVSWRQTGGTSLTLEGKNSTTLKVSNIKRPGTYVFMLTAEDNKRAQAYDFANVIVHAPPNNWNYVREENLLIPGVTDAAGISGLPVTKRTEKTTYIDGMGRPMQVVEWQQSPDGVDIVQPIQYDAFGREYRRYLPFSSGTNGDYQEDKNIIDAANNSVYKGDAALFYNGSADMKGDSRPFSETIYEQSTLSRPIAEYGPGADWGPDGKDKPVRIANVTNVHGTAANQERIIAWKANDSGQLTVREVITNYIEAGGYYSTGQLNVKQVIDEQGHVVREYTDKNGVLILKRVQAIETTPATNNDGHWAETYYIYDDFGRLAMVLPPEGTRYARAALNQN